MMGRCFRRVEAFIDKRAFVMFYFQHSYLRNFAYTE
jgi:hypothetical protein